MTVVVTGIGLCTPIGNDLDVVSLALRAGESGVRSYPDWPERHGIRPAVAAPVRGVEAENYGRKRMRTMGRVAVLATHATEKALANAAVDPEMLGSGRVGITYGSTHGSSSEFEAWCRRLFANGGASMVGLPGSSYLRFMSHTAAANLAEYFGVRGRVQPTCSACTSGSQAIGLACEYLESGAQDLMIAGGSEELHFTHAGIFDLLYAASHSFNATPEKTPRPFDRLRDGVVVGEGATTLVLERREQALARGAEILGEIRGYATTCDGIHLTNPSWQGMAACMARGLASAQMRAEDVDYVDAHGTGTEIGDIAESRAMVEVLGGDVPVSTQKGLVGHTLGACGAMETAFALLMMRDGFLAANRNLEEVDPRCAGLDYVVGQAREVSVDRIMCNNFAFGGINTTLILARDGVG